MGVGKVQLAKEWIEAANKFLTNDGQDAGTADLLTTAHEGQFLVDDVTTVFPLLGAPFEQSDLTKISDGVIGVPFFKGSGEYVERILGIWDDGGVEAFDRACQADGTNCTVTAVPGSRYNKVRAAAFFSATMGFRGLHEGAAQRDKRGNPTTDAQGDPIYSAPGQMEILRMGTEMSRARFERLPGLRRRAITAAARTLLDEAFAKVSPYPPPPTKPLLITPALRAAVNTECEFDFIREEDIGGLVTTKNPEALSAAEGSKSQLQSGGGDGVIGVIRRGAVTVHGVTHDDGREETLLYHDGAVFRQRCDAAYTTCEWETKDVDADGNFMPSYTLATDRVLRVCAGLFGFRALFDDQLLKNFPMGGESEWQQRDLLDKALAALAKFRTETVEELPAAPVIVPLPPAATPTGVAPAPTPPAATTPTPPATAPAATPPAPSTPPVGGTPAAAPTAQQSAAPAAPTTTTPVELEYDSLFEVAAKRWFGADLRDDGFVGRTAKLVFAPAVGMTALYVGLDGLFTAARQRRALRLAGAVAPRVNWSTVVRGFAHAHEAGRLPSTIVGTVTEASTGALKPTFRPTLPFVGRAIPKAAGVFARWRIRGGNVGGFARAELASVNGLLHRVKGVSLGTLGLSALLALVPFIESEPEEMRAVPAQPVEGMLGRMLQAVTSEPVAPSVAPFGQNLGPVQTPKGAKSL